MRPTSLSFSTEARARRLRLTSSLSGAMAASAWVALGAVTAHAAGGAEIVTGNIAITAPNAHTTLVTQGQDKGIINWKGGMDVLSGDALQFAVPNANSVTLNRITNGMPTKIDGTLSSNGRLVVVNPSGMMVGATGQVNVSSLIATTADVKNSDFLAGKMNFTQPGDSNARIVNQGSITAQEGGLVALVAPSVRNDGVIQAKLGKVVLAGGASANALDLYGDGLYSFQMTDGNAAKQSTASVENHGTISATGGTVLLTANAAKNLVDHAINTDGIIEATSASVDQAGAIVLDGGQGVVKVAGKLDVSGKHGGNVTVTGGNIELASANIDARGATGGEVLIGGGAQGLGPVPHAQTVSVDATSKIDVSGHANDAGTAVLWSDKSTKFAGKIIGTAPNGKGGQAEISSKGTVEFTGLTDLHGQSNGLLLIDPADIDIDAPSALAYSLSLQNNDVLIATGNSGMGSGNINVNAPISWASSYTLNLNAFGDVTLNNTSLGGVSGTTNIVAGKNIVLNNGVLGGFTSNFNLNAIDVTLNGTSFISTGGNIVINNSGVFSSAQGATLNSFGGGIAFNQSANGSIQNAINAIGVHTNTATLKLGTGVFDEHFDIDEANVNLVGSGTSNTYIRPSSMAGAPISTLDGVDYSPIVLVSAGNVHVSDLTIDNGGIKQPVLTTLMQYEGGEILISNPVSAIKTIGIEADSYSGFVAQNNIILADIGLALGSADAAKVTNNIVLANNIGLYSTSSDEITVSGNYFQAMQGVRLEDQVNSIVSSNGINATNTGLIASNIYGLSASGNSISTPGTGVVITGGTNATLSGDNILAGTQGVDVSNAEIFELNTSSITVDPAFFGVSAPAPIALGMTNVSDATVSANFLKADFAIVGSQVAGSDINLNNIEAADTGISLTGGSDAAISVNTIKAGNVGVALDSETNAILDTNTIKDADLGIDATNVSGLTLTANALTNVGDGISAIGVSNLDASFNSALGRGDAGSVGFLVGGSDNAVLNSNYLQFFADGIQLIASDFATLTANFAGSGGRGLYVADSDNATINGGNSFSTNAVAGVLIADGSTATNVSGNFFSDNKVGIDAASVTGVTANENAFFSDATAMRLSNVVGANLGGNILNALLSGVVGIELNGTNGALLSNNQFKGYPTGLRAAASNNLSLSGDVFTGNAVGVTLSESSNARLDTVNFTTPAGGTGLELTNGSGNATLRNLAFSGGDVGVRISDTGSSAQFESNGSTFDSMGQYFVLANGAMVGTTLDASQQSFDGVRASNFSEAQRDAAEGITTDVADNATLGDVFYKDFAAIVPPVTTPVERTPPAPVTSAPLPPVSTPPVSTPPASTPPASTPPAATGVGGPLTLSALNEFQIERTYLFRNGLFSYAGRTLSNNVALAPYSFQVAAVNLSLLAPAAGGPGFGGAAQLANLSTAAGGEGGGQGSGADQLANLSPAAGAGLNCGNSFLGSGYQPGFEAGSCSVGSAQ